MRITAIGTSCGSTRVDNVKQAAGYGRDVDFVESRLGPLSLPQATAEDTTVSLAATACREALREGDVSADQIGLLIMVTQNPDFGGLPHNSAILQNELDVPTSAMCFDMGLGCSGYVYGLCTAEALMIKRKISHALLVTSDQYRANLRADDINTQLLFGDCAAATVLQLDDRPGFRFAGSFLGTDGAHHKALIRTDEGIAMNGRAIYGFSRKVVPEAIHRFLSERHLTLDSIDRILLHQGSRAIIDEITKILGVPTEKVPMGMTQTGNSVSSSLPFMLKPYLSQHSVDNILLAGFGVGLSYGVGLLTNE